MFYWGVLTGYCFPSLLNFDSFDLYFQINYSVLFILYSLALLTYCYIICCFLYRKLSRGDFCENSAQTVFCIISLCIMLCATCQVVVLIFRFCSVHLDTAQKSFVWTIFSFGELLSDMGPYFCTLLLALYRFCSTCNPVRDMRHVSSFRLWIYFLVFMVASILVVFVQKMFICDPLHLYKDKLNSIHDYFGVFRFIAFDLIIPLLGLITITSLHYKAINQLKSSYFWERQTLLDARPELLGSMFVMERRSRKEFESRVDKYCLNEEK